jgi:hypothetical protein
VRPAYHNDNDRTWRDPSTAEPVDITVDSPRVVGHTPIV